MTLLAELVGDSRAMVAVRERVEKLLSRQRAGGRLPPILIEGETGTGKGFLARLIHRAGPRASRPFVDLNCAAIPDTLLEAELFGYERGAFTDARQAKAGLFQAAHGGTLFLDEIALLAPALQAKLLTAIEERVVRRLGATRAEPVDVAIIAATNAGLAAAVADKRFRADLYHRLAVLTVTLPPLRERGDDVLRLAERLLERCGHDYGVAAREFTDEARAVLRTYSWPGNIRELANVVERAVLMSDGPSLPAEALALPRVEAAASAAPALRARTAVERTERSVLLEAMEQSGGNITRAAVRLGLSRNTLRYRLQKHGLFPAATPSPSAPPSAAAPPTPVAAPALARGASLRWERRRLTFVRARLAPDAAVATGTTVALDTLLEKVRVFGGRVAEFGRGGMLAIFGLDPVEDAPRRAANAALAAIKTLERAEPAAPLPRVGLHVAEGLIGRVDADVEVDADDRDQARVTLDELAAAAPPGAVVVSVAAVPFIRRWFETEDEGAGRRIVGRERAVGSGASLVPFVGRAHELRQLAVALERATAGTGGAVGVTGEAGLGKTRLLLEFRGSLHGRDVTWIEGRCLSYTASTPYVPLLGVLRSLCGTDDADDAVTVAERLRATLAAVGLDEDDTAAVLLHLLGVRSGPPAPEPDVVRRRLLETLRDLLLRHGRRRPLVVAIEDLHWADPSSRECLASLVDVVSSGPILALFTYRPGNAPPWLGSSFASQIALSPLPLEDSARLVAAVLGAEGATRPVTDRILARGEGNPFFLEELARAVRDRDERALDAAPQTVEDVLRARIDWLAADDRDALQRAAVVGKDVAPDLLAGIADAPADAVRAATRRLAAGEFLQLTASGHYTFTHALTHEVAYATIPEDRRRELHARAVDVLVQRHGEDRAEQAEKLADHARRAMRWEAAAYYARLAGDKALARSAYREAAERFRSALDALDRLPASREVTEQKINVHFALRTALTPLGEHGQIAEHLHEAERIARELQDDRRLGRVSAYLADYFRQVGEHQRAIAAGEEALAIARRLDDLPLEIAANLYIGQACDNVGRYRRALVFFRRNVELTAGEHGRSTFGLPFITSVQARTWVAGCLRELGEFPAGLAAAREAVEIAESANHPVSLAPASSVLGHLHLRMGEPARALASLERGRDLSQGSRLNLWLPVAESWLGLAYVGVGRSAEGLALLEAAVARERSMQRLAHHSARLAALGDGYAAVGRWKEARDEVTRALDLARRQGERGNEAHALRLHGEIAFRQDGADLAAAVTFLEAALTLAAELEMAPVAARCRLGLAAVARQRHDDENARRHLDAACALLGAFGAPALLEAADALRRD